MGIETLRTEPAPVEAVTAAAPVMPGSVPPGPDAAAGAWTPSPAAAAPATAPVSAPVSTPPPGSTAAPFAPPPFAPPPGGPRPDGDRDAFRPSCTVAQLRRFIKSRPWIPMHELRRRFGIYGGDDDVSPIRVGAHTLFIGLPPGEARLMAELLGGGDVGFELSLDPVTPIVVGVYPMRPVPRG